MVMRRSIGVLLIGLSVLVVYGDIKRNESGNVTKQLKADKDDEGDYPDNEKGSPNGEDVFLRLMQYLKDVHLILPIKLFKTFNNSFKSFKDDLENRQKVQSLISVYKYEIAKNMRKNGNVTFKSAIEKGSENKSTIQVKDFVFTLSDNIKDHIISLLESKYGTVGEFLEITNAFLEISKALKTMDEDVSNGQYTLWNCKCTPSNSTETTTPIYTTSWDNASLEPILKIYKSLQHKIRYIYKSMKENSEKKLTTNSHI